MTTNAEAQYAEPCLDGLDRLYVEDIKFQRAGLLTIHVNNLVAVPLQPGEVAATMRGAKRQVLLALGLWSHQEVLRSENG